MESLLNIVHSRGIVDNPDYHRGYVWTLDDKVALIDSVMNDRAIGSFIFIEYPLSVYDGRLEVMDGKQRLNAITEFYCSHFPYKGKYYHQMSNFDRDKFDSTLLQHAQLDDVKLTTADKLQIFLDVNCAGVPQTAEHLKFVKAKLEAEKQKESEVKVVKKSSPTPTM